MSSNGLGIVALGTTQDALRYPPRPISLRGIADVDGSIAR
jgi:hypothetical protein